MVCVLTSAAVQITSFYAQIALKLLHIPSVIILDVIFSDLGRIGKYGKQKRNNMMQRHDTDWHLLKQKRNIKQTKHEQ